MPAGDYALSLGQLTISDSATVDGAAASTTVVRQTGAGRVIEISSAVTVELNDLTVRDGVLAAAGAGILTTGTLTLERMVVASNEAIGSPGGGIATTGPTVGPLTILNSTIGSADPADGNRAAVEGGGVSSIDDPVVIRDSVVRGNTVESSSTTVSGGGISTSDGGPLTIERSQIVGNTARVTNPSLTPSGGGISVNFGTLTLRDSLVEGNASTGGTTSNGGGIKTGGPAIIQRSTVRVNGGGATQGGGIFHLGAMTMDVQSSTISANTADVSGGGVLAQGPVSLTNVTLSGNQASGGSGQGGGVRVLSTGSLAATHATIAGNSATGQGDGIESGGNTVTLRATILDNHPADNCGAGSFVSGGFNLDSGTTCKLNGTGDKQNASAALGPLQDNGGPTQTRAIGPGSPALDAVTSGCPPPAVDQRNAARPQGVACDAGAFEFSPPPVPADRLAPRVSAFSLSRKRFRVGRQATPLTARAAPRRRRPARRGSAFRFTLSERAVARIVIERVLRGRKVGKRCRAPSRKLHNRRRCTRFRRAGMLTRRNRAAGPNTIRFSGRIARRALKPARYRATITAADAGGNRSKARRASFRVVRR